MLTRLYRLQGAEQDWAPALEDAAGVLRSGGLVAFPTETVYGLGANALDPRAVRRIFEAKGRPQDNPLIVHVASTDQVRGLVRSLPRVAERLMEAFWPGPLTLVLPRLPVVPLEVTAGLETVGVRFPSHPVAQAMLRAAGVPVAAPSANRSGRPSPTTAQHVMEDMEGRVEVVLDGGPCGVGVESTVVDCTTPRLRLLRPGGVTPQDLERVAGPVDVDPRVLKVGRGGGIDPGVSADADTEAGEDDLGPVASPGMKYRHYAPQGEATLFEGDKTALPAALLRAAEEAAGRGLTVAIVASDEALADYRGPGHCISLGSRRGPAGMASALFGALRRCDQLGAGRVLLEGVEPEGVGLAIANRLRRAAGGRVVRL
ncbi:MAG: L-threonylcarbamoyladenylate synthase [Bacillota bacterium]